MKRALYKAIERGGLYWEELEEVLIDVEVVLNERPLCYVEDIQQAILTPNSMIFSQTNQLPELKPHHLEDQSLRKTRATVRSEK